jgi:hypothetical protein
MNNINLISKFDDVKDKKLQAYNRFTIAFNLNKEGRKADAKDYLEQFNKYEKLTIGAIAHEIREKGANEVLRSIQVDMSDSFKDVA